MFGCFFSLAIVRLAALMRLAPDGGRASVFMQPSSSNLRHLCGSSMLLGGVCVCVALHRWRCRWCLCGSPMLLGERLCSRLVRSPWTGSHRLCCKLSVHYQALVLSSVDTFPCAAWSRKERAFTLVHGAHAYSELRDSKVASFDLRLGRSEVPA